MVDGNSKDALKAEKLSAASKKKFVEFWNSIKKNADEHWTLNLRSTANLIGFSLFPVGWAWAEYPAKRHEERMPYEQRAQRISQMKVESESEDNKEGFRAFRCGIAYRRNKAELHLMRMIKRQEIPVTLFDDAGVGRALNDRMRLDSGLRIDIRKNLIGLDGLSYGHVWQFETDTAKVWDALAGKGGWMKNDSTHDWLLAERYMRELFETHGVPKTRDEYFGKTAERYSLNSIDGTEPSTTELRALASKLYTEYSFSEI